MTTIKVLFSDGDTLITRINGSKEEIEQYYLGKTFNTGSTSDHLVKCVGVEFLNW